MMRAPGKIRFMNMRCARKSERLVRKPVRRAQKPVRLSGLLFIPAMLSALFSVFIFVGCAKSADKEWKSPADDATLSKLEAATLEKGITRERRARLFFLWGQELASRSGVDPSKTDVRNQAIGAFERVVDLNSILVDESRFNLEILWRQKNRQNQQNQQQNSQDKQDQKDQKDQKDQQKNGQNQQDKQNGNDTQNGKSGKDAQADQQKQDTRNDSRQKSQDAAGNKASEAEKKDNAGKAEPKDLSAYVRDKEQSSELDKALKAELERRNKKQNSEAGGIVPVEKDW